MKICSQCGSQQQDDAAFCNKCGSSFNNAVIPPQQVQQAVVQLPAMDTQAYTPDAVNTKKPNRKAVVMICAITAVVAVTVLLLFLFVFRSNKQKIIGTWKLKNSDEFWVFNKDGTALIYGKKTNYSVDGDKLRIDMFSVPGNENTAHDITIVDITDDTMVLRSRTKNYFSSTDPDRLISVEESFTRISDEKTVKAENDNARLKQANANAKLAFTVINNKASELIADGERVDAVYTNGVVPVERFKNSADPLLQAVYKALSDGEDQLGYIYIAYDPNAEYEEDVENAVQWSENSDGDIFGQYPYPIQQADDNARFGTIFLRWNEE